MNNKEGGDNLSPPFFYYLIITFLVLPFCSRMYTPFFNSAFCLLLSFPLYTNFPSVLSSKYFCLFSAFSVFSAWKSKKFLYFCNQVLANRRDTTLLWQIFHEPRSGRWYDFNGKFKSIRYYFAFSQKPRKLLGNNNATR